MASSSSSAVPTPLLGQVVATKLNKGNYVLWRVQVLPIIRGAQLQGYLDGTSIAPEKEVNVKITDKTQGKQPGVHPVGCTSAASSLLPHDIHDSRSHGSSCGL
jgi:hypothetical protein